MLTGRRELHFPQTLLTTAKHRTGTPNPHAQDTAQGARSAPLDSCGTPSNLLHMHVPCCSDIPNLCVEPVVMSRTHHV